MRFWKLYATSRAFNLPRWLSFKIAWNGRNGPNDKMIAAREFYLKHTSNQGEAQEDTK